MKHIKVKHKSTFAKYGLNVGRNILKTEKCPCGCGHYMSLILKTDADVCGFMHAILEEHDCNHCGIFARKKDNTVLFGLKLDGEIQCYSTKATDNVELTVEDAHKAVKEMQRDLQLHCYGLLEQEDETSYKIIMD